MSTRHDPDPYIRSHNHISPAVALLERWCEWSEQHVAPIHGSPALSGYSPYYLHWGVQSNWNYVAATATLAAQPEVHGTDRWRDRAMSALRLALATHVTGDRTCGDGHPWGHSWISMLGIERAMHGVAHLLGAFTESDADALRRVIVSEADWLLHHAARGRNIGLFAGKWNSSGQNVPESNIWSGALLWRAAAMFPNEPGAASWKDRAHDYFVNGVSVEADACDRTMVAGKPVAERHVGANFFPNYALDHHGYMNVGYMAICISNAAILHFDAKRAGFERPESLDHHQRELWSTLKRMLFSDGRLARIGGDSRVRYAYCQEYLLPSLLYAADRFSDPDALTLAEAQLALIELESRANTDGSFYGTRVAYLRDGNPHYYTRLESDRAVALAAFLNYRPLVDAPPASRLTFDERTSGDWVEHEHGAVLTRGVRRFASFSWRARELGQALCLPPDESSLAEWSRNLCPIVRFLGDTDQHGTAHRRLISGDVESVAGGFVAYGSIMEGIDVTIDEGASCTDQAVTQLVFAALPDDRTCVVLQRVVAASDRTGYVTEVKGLHLNVPNDVLNSGRRTVHSQTGESVLHSAERIDTAVRIAGPWLNIDNVLGVRLVYGADSLVIDRSCSRRGGAYRSLFVDEVCAGVHLGPRRLAPGEVLVDLGAVIIAGTDSRETQTIQATSIATDDPHVRGVCVRGADGRDHVVAANFGPGDSAIVLANATVTIAAGKAVMRTMVDFHHSSSYREEGGSHGSQHQE